MAVNLLTKMLKSWSRLCWENATVKFTVFSCLGYKAFLQWQPPFSWTCTLLIRRLKMKLLGLILLLVASGWFELSTVWIFLIWKLTVLIGNVNAGGENFDPFAPLCEFGPFGIIMNIEGDCSKPCGPNQYAVQVNYGGADICCCN